MTGVIFTETLRRNWRAMLIWGGLIGLDAVYCVFLAQNSQLLKQYADIIANMPSFVMGMVGGADAAFAASPEGFLGIAYYGWVLLAICAYAVVAGLNITANEEDRGIMDVVLSMPVPRWRVVVEKFLAYTLLIAGIIGVGHVILVVSTLIWSGHPMDQGRLIESSFNMLPASLFVLGFTALISVILRRRSTATSLAAGFVAVSYLIDVVGRSAQSSDVLRTISFYSYYDSTTVLQHGLQWGNVIGLVGIAVIMLIGAVVIFQRRDVGL
jgi:ABC-2 type transport system permease protein